MLLTSVIIYLLITILTGYFASRAVKNSGDFMLAGRSLPLFLSSAALFATWFGSETILGASAQFAQQGLLGVIEEPFGAALCLILYGLFFAIPLYRMNLLTLSDLFRVKFGIKTEILSAILLIPSYFGWIAAQLLALGILLHSITSLTVSEGVIICTVIVAFYTSLGGMWAVSITDFIQSIIIVLGLLILAGIMLIKAGGINNIISQTPDNFFRYYPEASPKEILTYISAWITLGLGSIPSQDVFQRAMSSKTEKVARNSSILGGLLYLFIAMLPLFIILCTKTVYPEALNKDLQHAIPRIVMQHTPVIVQILFFGALISAILSTASAAILAPASVLSENIIKTLYKEKLKDKHFLLILRLSVIAIAAISAFMATLRNNIYELVGESSAFTLVSLFIPMTAAVYCKKASAQAAICSMLSGLFVWAVFHYFSILPEIPATIPGLCCSALGFITGQFLVKQKAENS